MALDTFQILNIVRIVLIGLVLFPAIFLFAKLARKPGYRQDTTRRWVDYTKGALGLWILTQLILVIIWIIIASTVDVYYWAYDSVAERVVGTLGFIQTLTGTLVHVAIFLALIYMAHALTQLRTGDETASKAFRRGRGWALGGSILVLVLAFVSFCLYLSILFDVRSNYIYSTSWNLRNMISLVFRLTCQAIFLIMAIASVVYSAKSRKKARGTGVAKAGTLLVVCSSLFLVREAWDIVVFFFGGRFYNTYIGFEIVDVFLGAYLTFAILVILYLVATKGSYSMSKANYRTKVADDEQRV